MNMQQSQIFNFSSDRLLVWTMSDGEVGAVKPQQSVVINPAKTASQPSHSVITNAATAGLVLPALPPAHYCLLRTNKEPINLHGGISLNSILERNLK